MSRRVLFPIIPVLVVLALFAGSGSTRAQTPTGGGPQVAVSAAFTYQGRLQDSAGNPVNSTCDFTFSAWDAPSGGTQVGTDCVVTSVQVVDGYFTAQLNAGGEFGSAFQGDARWLQIAVQCTGDPAPTTLAPLQELTATPYALSLMPGAMIKGAGGLTAWDPSASGAVVGLTGWSDSPAGTGVSGWNDSATGVTYGVYGRADSHRGTGVYGWASAATGNNFGVYGTSDSPDGVGVYGNAAYAGVEGDSDDTAGTGVYGYVSATSGHTWGVYGQTKSSDGIGVYGWADASSGSTYGIYGYSASPAGIGVYGWGNFGVEGETNDWIAVFGNNTSTDVSSSHIGVVGQTAGTDVAGRNSVGVQGYATDPGGGIGVRGVTAGGGIAVLAESYATSGQAWAVLGSTNSTDGYGVYGSSPWVGVEGIGRGTSGYTAGVYGSVNANGGGYAVHGYDASTTGENYAIYGKTDSADGWAGYFYATRGNGVYISGAAGKTGLNVAGGSKNAVVATAGGARLLYTEESSEVWFADYGTGQLTNGSATVTIDPIYAQTVNLDKSYLVFLTPQGDCGLYVADKTPASFTVRALDGKTCSIAFDYRIVAKRLGFENARLERAPWADNDPNLYPEKRPASPSPFAP